MKVLYNSGIINDVVYQPPVPPKKEDIVISVYVCVWATP